MWSQIYEHVSTELYFNVIIFGGSHSFYLNLRLVASLDFVYVYTKIINLQANMIKVSGGCSELISTV
jgi:hypothetical protein